MKWSIAGLVVLGIVAGLSAFLLVLVFANRNTASGREPGNGEVTVVVATTDLPANSIVNSGGIEVRKVPAANADKLAISSPVEAVGKILKTSVTAGQPLNKDMFVTENSAQLAGSVPTGMRAVAISLTDFAGLDGVLYCGSTVDVLLTTNGNAPGKSSSRTILEGVQVLAVDRQTIVANDSEKKTENDDRRGQNARRVTLLVTSKQAAQLCLAMGAGTLTLALRNPMDKNATFDTPVSLASLMSSRDDAAQAKPVDENSPAAPENTPAASGQRPAASVDTQAPAVKTPWQVTIFRGSSKEVVEVPVESGSAKMAKDQ